MTTKIDHNRMTTKEAADYLNLKPDTLKTLRYKDSGPNYYKLGGVFYKQSDLDEFIESKKVITGADNAQD